VGRRRGEQLIYAGKVDHGFTPKNSDELLKRPLTRKVQPYTKRIDHRGIWVEPIVLARN
jgi:bifunctional non-homologous end joining protein LigD